MAFEQTKNYACCYGQWKQTLQKLMPLNNSLIVPLKNSTLKETPKESHVVLDYNLE